MPTVCGVVFVLAFLTGCGRAQNSASTESTQLTIGVAEGTAASGGGLGADEQADMLAYEGLTLIDADGRVQPRLASSWRWENENRRLRVFLRPNVRFHDDTPLTAALVAGILGKIVSNFRLQALYPSLAQVKSVTPDGELQLVVDLTDRSTFLLEDLSVALTIGDPEVGTGPYRIVKRTGEPKEGFETSELVLERFESYHSGLPAIARVVIHPFDTLRTTWTSLLRSDVDMVTDAPPNSVEFIRNDDIQVVSWERWYQYMLLFNSSRPPFASAAVRKALNLAVDRDALIRRVLHGEGTAATGPLWPKYWAYDTSVAAYGFNPAEAEALLDAAGFPMPVSARDPELPPARLRFTCLVPENFTVWHRIALEVQKSLFNVGVDMRVKVVPFDEYNTLLGRGDFEGGGFDAAIIDLISGPTPGRAYIFWRSAQQSKGMNVFGYENAEAERMFQVLRTNTNEAAVRSALTRLERTFLDDPPALFLAWNERARAIRREFRVYQEGGRDPLATLWRWTPTELPQLAAQQ